jgi:hypothetical protein
LWIIFEDRAAVLVLRVPAAALDDAVVAVDDP